MDTKAFTEIKAMHEAFVKCYNEFGVCGVSRDYVQVYKKEDFRRLLQDGTIPVLRPDDLSMEATVDGLKIVWLP